MNLSERIEFLTQIHTAWDGTEQRAALRLQPRRYVSYEYIGVKNWQSQYLRALTYTQQTQKLQFPLWHGAARLKRKAEPGGQTVHLDTDQLWAYRGCSGVMLWTNDTVGGMPYALQTIASDGVLGLKEEMADAWAAGKTVVCPLAWGVLQQEDKYTNEHSLLTTMQINVELLPGQLAPDFPQALDEFHDEPVSQIWGKDLPTQYQGSELFLTPPPWTKEITANFQRNANRLDNNSGVFLYDLKSTDPTETKEIEYVLTSRVEINNLQRFFCRCQGRLKSFWAPTWLSDVELAAAAPAGQNFLLAKWPLYWKYYSAGQRRKNLVVFKKDGSGQLLSIAGYGIDSTGERGKLYLDSPLSSPLESEEVLMLSYLCRYRLDNDTLTTDYDTVDVATMTFNLAEVTE
ncbi:Hypothetical protein LUCI_0772 [Lucifera butyrica]|uniref:Uncharacterized protein n=1 Tax=Lucifera butyrica TaxID=1351585 RepID=A0A498R5P7_9FIRM|nr:hypothetical protein [Lucifera butyrica]VBB05562.1 Hypothetical protein LUCI_0772 [Lucifera butyrica]